MLLLQKAHTTLMTYHDRIGAPLNAHLGRLVSPDHYARAAATITAGIPVAADNAAFSGFNENRYLRMLNDLRDLPLLWCVAPDVVADAQATDALWPEWAPIIREHGLPPCYVAQDGWQRTPQDAAAVFIGGTDTFKLGPAGEAAMLDAKTRGLPLHVGRVNGTGRIGYLAVHGADTFDGTGYSMYTSIYLHDGLRAAAAPPAARLDFA